MDRIDLTVAGSKEMIDLGRKLARVLRPGDRVLLSGVLGAGKTTLVKGIADGLGYKGNVTSPTFTLMNIYPGGCPIYHIDFYRLDNIGDDDVDWEEHYYGDGVTLVEWPDPVLTDEDDVRIDIGLTDDDYDLPRQVAIIIPTSRAEIMERLNDQC